MAPDCVVLHQMGFIRGGHEDQYDGVTAHFGVLRNGRILYLHSLDEYLHASNGLNWRGIAIEFEGAFPSERGRWHHAVRDEWRLAPTQVQIAAGRELIHSLIRTAGIRYVFAHRQSNEQQKPNCPGPHIWYNVGDFFVRNGMLSDGGPGYTYSRGERSGAPIPDEWRDASMELMNT